MCLERRQDGVLQQRNTLRAKKSDTGRVKVEADKPGDGNTCEYMKQNGRGTKR